MNFFKRIIQVIKAYITSIVILKFMEYDLFFFNKVEVKHYDLRDFSMSFGININI